MIVTFFIVSEHGPVFIEWLDERHPGWQFVSEAEENNFVNYGADNQISSRRLMMFPKTASYGNNFSPNIWFAHLSDGEKIEMAIMWDVRELRNCDASFR